MDVYSVSDNLFCIREALSANDPKIRGPIPPA